MLKITLLCVSKFQIFVLLLYKGFQEIDHRKIQDGRKYDRHFKNAINAITWNINRPFRGSVKTNKKWKSGWKDQKLTKKRWKQLILGQTNGCCGNSWHLVITMYLHYMILDKYWEKSGSFAVIGCSDNKCYGRKLPFQEYQSKINIFMTSYADVIVHLILRIRQLEKGELFL